MRLIPLLGFVLVGLPACGAAQKSGAAETQVMEAEAEETKVPDARPVADAPPPATAGTMLLDCPAEPGDDHYCTDTGKLAGEWMMVDLLPVPSVAEEIFLAETSDSVRQPSLRVSVDGGLLYIEHVSCGGCARVMGQGFRGQLDALSDDQLRAMQARLGLDDEVPAMTNAQQWRGYVAGPGRRALHRLLASQE